MFTKWGVSKGATVESAGLRGLTARSLGHEAMADTEMSHVAPTRRAAPPRPQGGEQPVAVCLRRRARLAR
jgi:hypothetical protein